MNRVVESPCHPGDQIHGFDVTAVTPVTDLRAVAVRCEHRGSGAQLLHLFAPSDSENCLAVTFPTPPPDDSGVPHILEHSVLAGSERYPVKEPFLEMLKTSVATFINAMTYPTFTTYPIASPVKKDFFNLAEVYLDAVFHPLLSEEVFRREGHHLCLEDNSDLSSPLSASGIVFSEMKGVYSTPDALIDKLAQSNLFPDTCLGRDSGGDPDRILELSYGAFKDFYAKHYHPSNAQIFLYGDIPTDEHLAFLDQRLAGFSRAPARISLARQPRWTEPREIQEGYPVGADENLTEKTYFRISWLVGDALDPARVLEWELLERILLGDEAAPLKKAIVDSKLGADLFSSGVEDMAHELLFHVGLNASEPERLSAFERLVHTELARLAKEGIDPARIEAAFQQLSYETLEVRTLFPLRVLSAVQASWPLGGDPLLFLRTARDLEACRQRVMTDPGLLGRRIREGLLDNPHRLSLALRPDPQAAAKANEAFARRMAEKRARLSQVEVAEIARSASALDAAQGVPNSPEAVARLPRLKTSDLARAPRHIPTQVGQVGGITVLKNDVFSNTVSYLTFDIDLTGLPRELIHYVPRFNDAIQKMGAAGQSYSRIAERRAASVGDLVSYPVITRSTAEPGRTRLSLRLGIKTLDAQADKALELVTDLLFSVDPRDRERLRQVMNQVKTGMRRAMVSDALDTAQRHSIRSMTQQGALQDLMYGVRVLGDIERMVNRFDESADTLIQNIEQVRDAWRHPSRIAVSFTGTDRVFAALERALGRWGDRLQKGQPADTTVPVLELGAPRREGLAAPLQVAHCVTSMPAPHLADRVTPLLQLAARYTTHERLLPELRLKGNAYGAYATHDPGRGVLSFMSYRDPRVAETLRVFEGLRQWAADTELTNDDVERAILGHAKSAEVPLRASDATYRALDRFLRGDTDQMREQRYTAALGATPKAVKTAWLEVLEAGAKAACTCVVASRDMLTEANRTLSDDALQIQDLVD